MPVYEFYCSDCHRIFNFMSRRINTTKRPDCPKCSRKRLERRVSLFSVSKGLEESDNEDMPDIDESRLERAMEALAGEAENINEEDPRQVAGLMRKLFDSTGLDLGPGMDEAIRRMESGEDPDQIEEEMGDLLEGEDPLAGLGKKGGFKSIRRKYLPPSVDETLYEL
jgi:putative FmdB family regulatory protein